MSDLLYNSTFHRLMFKINVFFVITNMIFMIILEDSTINFLCALLTLCGALSSYISYTKLEEQK